MHLQELTNIVNKLYYNDSSSYKVTASKQSCLLAYFRADIAINKIDTNKINNYIEYLKHKGNKPATINTKLAYLSKIMTYAYEIGLIKNRPAIKLLKLRNKKDKFLSSLEYEAILNIILSKKWEEMYKIIVIGYNTGIRISNILSILPEDIDNGYIRIYHNKTNRPYSVPMNEAVRNVMKDFKGFTLKYKQVHYKFDVIKKELGLDERITIHTLRHTTCSKLVEKGVPLPVVQALMNHSNIQTTMRYNHLKNEQLELAVAML